MLNGTAYTYYCRFLCLYYIYMYICDYICVYVCVCVLYMLNILCLYSFSFCFQDSIPDCHGIEKRFVRSPEGMKKICCYCFITEFIL